MKLCDQITYESQTFSTHRAHFSNPNRRAYPSTGDVIDVKTRRIVATLEAADHNAVQSEKMVEIHFQNGRAVAIGDQFGIGVVR